MIQPVQVVEAFNSIYTFKGLLRFLGKCTTGIVDDKHSNLKLKTTQ